MTGLTWLHLSDWHQGSKEFDREVVRDKLMEDLEKREAISPDLAKIDFIIFSGDVAYSGKQEEYQAAKEQLLEPILEVVGLNSDKLFIVPGNHDLDRIRFELLPGALMHSLKSDAEIQNWLTDDQKRARLLDPFGAFASFVMAYTGQNQPDYANICRWEIGGKKIMLIGLNSAWMCGRKDSMGNENERGYVLVGEPQIHEPLEKSSEAEIKIAVLHHPFSWLAELDGNRVEGRLMHECDFILHGHQHKPQVKVIHETSGDSIIIPAGACYNRRNPTDPRYANSYNLVHLDFDTGNGVVFLRRWSDPRTEWIRDEDSCPGGKFEFPLRMTTSNTSLSCDHQIIASKNEIYLHDHIVLSPIFIPHQIPPPPFDFKGREEDISEILSNFDKGVTITGLRGMAGVGKTVLAFVLAERLKDRFPDGQLFIDMQGTNKSPLSPAEAMEQVIHAYYPTDRVPENQNELKGRYLSVLSGKRVLLLLDNAANREQVEPLLPPTVCTMLITSRIKFTLPGLKERDLDVLPADKACELLLGIAERIGDRADELAKLCGYLPLALRNAGSVLAERRDLGVSEYEQRLEDKKKLLELVEASFCLSYDLLSSIKKKQWCRLSVFPKDFDRNGAAAVWKLDRDLSAEALSDLAKWSLVDCIPFADSEECRYRMHDLARLFAESRLDPFEQDDALQRHAKHYLNVLSDANELYKKEKDILAGLNLFDRELGNIRAGQDWADEVIRTARISKKKPSMKLAMRLAISYPDKAVHLYHLRLHPQDRIHWLETAIIASRLMKDHDAEGTHLLNLGSAYYDLGEIRKAVECYEIRLPLARKIKDRTGEGIALGNLGNAYADLGETRKAIGNYDQALKIARKTGHKLLEGDVLSNFADAYADLGEMPKAIEYYNKSQKIYQEIGERPNESECFLGLGDVYADLGKTEKVIEYSERALKIAHEIGDHRCEGHGLCCLGKAYVDLGEPQKAIEYCERALKIAREVGDRKGEGAALCDLGEAYSDMGDVRKAIEYCEQALEIEKRMEYRKGENDVLIILGNAYIHLSDTGMAIKYYKQALEIARKIEYRMGESEALFNLSLALEKLGQGPKAMDHAKAALKIFELIGCPDAEKARQKLAEWQEKDIAIKYLPIKRTER